MLNTNRLIILPLNPDQLKLWLEDIPALEKELNATYHAEPMAGLFRDIVLSQYQKTLQDPKNYLYHSFWFLIRNTDRAIVGAADFKGPPDNQGQVEIGYGLGPEFEKQGFMTEAVTALCQWALQQKK